MKQRRGARDWPNGIVEIPSTRPDPRGDPQATQKISRAEIDAVLQRTKSGTRAVVRPKSEPSMWPDEVMDPDAPSGPREDDAPEIMIVSIESVEPSAPTSARPSAPTSAQPSAPTSARPSAPTSARPSAPTSARPSAPTSARPSAPTSPMSAHLTPPSAALDDHVLTQTTAPSAFTPAPPAEDASRVALTPRLAFVTGIALVAFITLAALIGFLAGRLSGH